MILGRRDFMRLSALAAATAGLGGAAGAAERRDGMPYRVLGKTGAKVSLLCLGGFHIGVSSLSDEDSIRLQRTAIDAGVNFLDNAYIYHNGRSETLMGRALRDGYREKAFLMTKHFTDARDAESVKRQLEESLTRLQTDVIDLWQVHQVQRAAHAPAVYENGVLDVMEKAREEGKVRFLGFTGHSRPEYHLEMIERGFAWDALQMPVNAVDHHWTSFEKSVLPKAIEKGIGVIGMKSLGGSPGQFVNRANVFTAAECLRYAMSLPVASVVSGIDTMERLEENLAIAKAFEPLTQDELAAMLSRSREIADGGTFEPYKDKELEQV